jgi:very-short-patch-repair endonuclease
MRSLALLAAPAESPMETRLRWLLIHAGLRQAQVQTNLYDSAARFIGRADLYYPEARLVVEYDGGNHRDRMVDDNRRQNLLVNSGYRVLRFTSADIHNRADVVVAQVQAALKHPFGARHVKSMSSKARLAPNVSNSGAVP